MANEYHDARGRFASKGEMAALVDTLQRRSITAETETERIQAQNEWFELKRDYENIVNKNVVVPEDFLRRNRIYISPTEDSPETVETAYFASLKQHLGDTGWDSQSFHQLLRNKNTPPAVRADILAGLGNTQRETILQRAVDSQERFGLDKDTLLQVAGNIDTTKKAQALFANKQLQYEDLLPLASGATIDNPMAELGAARPEFITDNSALGSLIYQEGNLASTQATQLRAYAVVARHTTDRDLQSKIVERAFFQVHSGVEYGNEERNPDYALATNYHLDPYVANRLLERTRDTSIDQYRKIEDAIIKTRDIGGDVRHVKRTPALGLTTVIDGEKFDYSDLPTRPLLSGTEERDLAALQHRLPNETPGAYASRYDRSTFNDADREVSLLISLQAKQDAQRDNFTALLKELKTMRRRKVPRTQQVSMARRINLAYLTGQIEVNSR